MKEAPGTSSPAARYRDGVADQRWQDDPTQHDVLDAMDHLQQAFVLRTRHRGGFTSWLQRRIGGRTLAAIEGLYVWGPVGRGKTFLMDLLVASLPTTAVRRWHFHAFMRTVHDHLKALANHSDPLPLVAQQVMDGANILCLDEFLVNDIGDAMILSGLLRGLEDHAITLVTTSNTAPGSLYLHGLQRAQFLPAIAWLESHCKVIHLESPHDWRLRTLRQAPIYQTPPGPEAVRALTRIFNAYARGEVTEGGTITIADRPIPVRRRAANIAWFDFDALCDGPRATSDYLELAQRYSAIVISHVPPFTPDNNDPATRFIHLVDAFYDCGVKLILSAALPIIDLYEGERLRAEFARTESRLIEMQSQDYLDQPHHPVS